MFVRLQNRWQQFWRHQLWQSPPESSWKTLGLHLLQILVLAWRDLFRRKGLLRASSLAYTAIMALIPLLALLFAIFKGLGLQRLLASHLLPQLTAGSQEFARLILDYIEGTKVASLGAFGVVWLLVALMILMSNAEEAFNNIWRLPRARAWWRKLTDYLSIFLLFPILMAVAVTMTSAFQRHPTIQGLIRDFLPPSFFTLYNLLFSFGMAWLGFTFIYLVMPYTRVRVASALLGGVVAGLLWQGAQWIFHLFQASAPYYNAIYGALYQLLFLVIWIFWSWLIVIYGAEVAYAHQNLERLRQEQGAPALTLPVLGFEFLALGVLLHVWRHFEAGLGPSSLPELTARLQQQEALTQEICQALVANKLLIPVAGGNGVSFLPSRPLSQVTVGEVLQQLQQYRWEQVAWFFPAGDQIAQTVAELAQAPQASGWNQTVAELLGSAGRL